jgi:dihydrofolate synthase/folylpolyglutamate synthase
MPVALPRVNPDTPASIHGMASVAIALEAFQRRKVDVIVFEAGAGGRFDLTNVIDTTLSVITNVGYDHVVSLGPSLKQIAWHKAGIARPGVPLITGAAGLPLEIIQKEASAVNAPLFVVAPKDDAFSHNRALAREAAAHTARQLGKRLSEDALDRGAYRVVLAGRSEVMPGTKPRVILDGAHNPEKLAVAVSAALAKAGEGPKVCLFGLLGAKANQDTVASLKGRFDHVVATEPTVYAKQACPLETMAELLRGAGYRPFVEPDEHRALDIAINLAKDTGTVLVTGSFYLVGNLRSRWFPKEAVVLRCTSFPTAES